MALLVKASNPTPDRIRRSGKSYVVSLASLGGINVGNGGPGEIRTPDLTVRSRSLYPTELRAPRKEFYYPARKKRKRYVVRISQFAALSLRARRMINRTEILATARNLQLSLHL